MGLAQIGHGKSVSLLRRAGFRWGLPVFRRIELLRKWEGHGAIVPVVSLATSG